MVINGDMEELPSDTRSTAPPASGDAMSNNPNSGQFLNVEKQVAGQLMLVPLDWFSRLE